MVVGAAGAVPPLSTELGVVLRLRDRRSFLFFPLLLLALANGGILHRCADATACACQQQAGDIQRRFARLMCRPFDAEYEESLRSATRKIERNMVALHFSVAGTASSMIARNMGLDHQRCRATGLLVASVEVEVMSGAKSKTRETCPHGFNPLPNGGRAALNLGVGWWDDKAAHSNNSRSLAVTGLL